MTVSPTSITAWCSRCTQGSLVIRGREGGGASSCTLGDMLVSMSLALQYVYALPYLQDFILMVNGQCLQVLQKAHALGMQVMLPIAVFGCCVCKYVVVYHSVCSTGRYFPHIGLSFGAVVSAPHKRLHQHMWTSPVISNEFCISKSSTVPAVNQFAAYLGCCCCFCCCCNAHGSAANPDIFSRPSE